MRDRLDAFDDYLQKVFLGQFPAERSFTCPLCGGDAQVAGREDGNVPGLLNFSAHCDDCHSGREYCGVPKWPGWESIRAED